MDAASFLLLLAIAGANIDSQPETVSSKQHTTYFADQGGWISDQSNPPAAAVPTGDRYQSGAVGSGATLGPPPSVVDRTRAAVIESSSALREGVEAGIQAANRQLYQGNEQVIDTARTAGQDLSKQFQGWAGVATQPTTVTAPAATGPFPSTLPTSARTRQQVSNPFAPSAPGTSAAPAASAKTRGGVAPPPWAAAPSANELDSLSDTETPVAPPRTAALSKAPVQTESGWTTVHSSLAPPPLVAPRLVNSEETASPRATASANAAPLQPLAANGGPNFPVTISANRDHSVLAQPRQEPLPPAVAATANESWGLGWDAKAASQTTQPATIGSRYGAAGISAGTEVARDGLTGAQSAATAPTTAPATGQTAVTQPATTVGIGAWDNGIWPPESPTSQPGAVVEGGPASTPAGSTTTVAMPANPASAGLPPTAAQQVAEMPPTLHAPAAEQLPWAPLLVVSLSLAGSIGANLFLGWSYIDARQKYRTLVQKTANKFRRAVAA
jgi:hypothetical protein